MVSVVNINTLMMQEHVVRLGILFIRTSITECFKASCFACLLCYFLFNLLKHNGNCMYHLRHKICPGYVTSQPDAGDRDGP
jgi:hypothetical protein